MEDCDPAIDAMAAADPDLDPVWGLLVDAAEEDSDTDETSTLAAPEKASAAANIARTIADTIAGCGDAVDAGDVPSTAGADFDSNASTSTPFADGGTRDLTSLPTKGTISNVVDKVEVTPDRFPLAPSTSGPDAVTRWEVKGCDAFVLDNVLTAEECQALIAQADGQWSFWDDSETPRVSFRNAHTVEVAHHELADRIWERVAHLVNPSVAFEDEDDPRFEVDIEGSWVPYGINPRLLLSRYLEGGHFSPHTDGTTVVDFNRRTFYSSVLFLNESPWGGHTRIYDDEQMRRDLIPDAEGRLTGDPALILEAVPPKVGRMLIFYHRLMHEGVPAAEKYIIRTDVLYRRDPEQCTAPEDIEAFKMYQEAQLRAEKGQTVEAAALFRRAFKLSDALRKVYRS